MRHVHTLLHGALKQAVRLGLIARNPTELIDAPRVPNHEIRPLDADEIRRFLAAARADRLYPLYLLCLTTGMRLGELLGLKWSDIDFEDRHADGAAPGAPQPRRRDGPARHDASRRSIKEALDALEEAPPASARGAPPGGADLARPRPGRQRVGKPFLRNHVTERSFKKLLVCAGLRDIRFHDLRHSAATLLFAAGVHPKIVQERLGHANIGITMDIYSHVLPNMQRTWPRRSIVEDDDGPVAVTVAVK